MCLSSSLGIQGCIEETVREFLRQQYGSGTIIVYCYCPVTTAPDRWECGLYMRTIVELT